MGADVIDSARSSRFFASLRAIVAELFPELGYGNFRYRVTSVSGNFVSCRPVRSDLGLPDHSRLQFRGAPGTTGTLVVGTVIVVSFTDGDGAGTDSRIPFISAVEGPDGAGFLPTELRLDASVKVDLGPNAESVVIAGAGATAYVLRHGDLVQLTSVVSTGSWPGAGAITAAILALNPAELISPGPPGAGHSKAVA